MAAALDVQLGERFLERGLNGRDFLGRVIFLHRHFGPLNRGFGGGGIDFPGLERHVGKYRNGVGFDFDETFADCKRSLASIFHDAQLARF
jgi:hypothetical protein